MEAVAPFRLAVPAVIVVIDVVPPTVRVPRLRVVTIALPPIVVAPPVIEEELSEPAETVPPEIAEVSKPVTTTVPPEIPPVVAASLAKEVWPPPPSEPIVTVPIEAVNCSAPTVVFALVTAPRLRPVPENVAKPVALRTSVALDFASTAVSVAPLTVMPEVPAREPASVTSVPAETVVAPE